MDDRAIAAMARRLERLERENRRWRWAGVASALAVAALAVPGIVRPRVVAAQQAAPPGEPARDATALVEDKLKMARTALKIIDQSASRGAIVNDPAFRVHYWSIRELGARIYLTFTKDEPKTQDIEVYLGLSPCAPNGERLAAFEDHLARMTYWEGRYRPLADTRKLSMLDFLVFRDHRLQAEAWLARERLRADGVPAKAP